MNELTRLTSWFSILFNSSVSLNYHWNIIGLNNHFITSLSFFSFENKRFPLFLRWARKRLCRNIATFWFWQTQRYLPKWEKRSLLFSTKIEHLISMFKSLLAFCFVSFFTVPRLRIKTREFRQEKFLKEFLTHNLLNNAKWLRTRALNIFKTE